MSTVEQANFGHPLVKRYFATFLTENATSDSLYQFTIIAQTLSNIFIPYIT